MATKSFLSSIFSGTLFFTASVAFAGGGLPGGLPTYCCIPNFFNKQGCPADAPPCSTHFEKSEDGQEEVLVVDTNNPTENEAVEESASPSDDRNCEAKRVCGFCHCPNGSNPYLLP